MRFLKPLPDGTLIKQGYYNDTGCVTLGDILNTSLDYSFLKAKDGSNICRNYKTRDKQALAKKIALDFLELLFDDIIETNNVFVLPVQQGAQIRIVSKTSAAVKSITKRKAYQEVDLFNSDWKIYEFVFDFWRDKKLRRRYIRINQDRYRRLVDKVNEGDTHYFGGFF